MICNWSARETTNETSIRSKYPQSCLAKINKELEKWYILDYHRKEVFPIDYVKSINYFR